MKTIAKTIYYVVVITIVAWFLLSWTEIAMHNGMPGHVYSTLNLFGILF